MDEISGSFNAVSVLLFLLGIGFDFFIGKFTAFSKDIPEKEKPGLNIEYLKRRREVQVIGLGLSLVTGIFTYLLLPTTFRIIQVSKGIELWRFNLMWTLFVFITLLSLVFFLSVVILTLIATLRPWKLWKWLFIK